MTEITYQMLDDVNLTVLGQHAANAHALGGYVDGYDTFPAIVATYGKSGKYLLSITIHGSTDAQCADYEDGAMAVSDAPKWHKATAALGRKRRDARWFPKHYASEGLLPDLVATLSAAGIKRAEYRIWSAHYSFKGGPPQPHVCGPDSCGSAIQADATQWTDVFDGVSLDASECFARFFDGPPVAKPPKPEPQRFETSGSVSLDQAAASLKVTVPAILAASALKLSTRNLRRLLAYLALGTSAVAPKGLVFWVVKSN